MKYLNYSVLACVLLISTLQVLNGNPSKPRTNESELKLKERQFLGIGALGGFANVANNNNAGNPFRQVTVTRTLIRTVSTITVATFRTCTTSAAVLPACAGRRRREIGDEKLIEEVVPEPSMVIIIGTTTMSDPSQVSSILHLDGSEQKQSYSMQPETSDTTTLLYPSREPGQFPDDDLSSVTTNTPAWHYAETSDDHDAAELGLHDNARINFAGTTTSTVTISVTSVASTPATGLGQTLIVSYAGCSPASLPVSGLSC